MSDAPKPLDVSTTAPQQSPVMRSQNYRLAYAGNFRFRINAVDSFVTFLSEADLPGGINIQQEEVGVMMTHSALKLLSEHLARAVSAIEQEMGPIRVPQVARPSDENLAGLIQALRTTPMVE